MRCILVSNRSRFNAWSFRPAPRHSFVSRDGEEWLPIPGFPPYEASTHGRIRKGYRLVTLTLNDSGYPTASISVGRGRSRTMKAHRLVFMAFKGPIPDGHVVDHIDGVRANSRPDNLEAVTQNENMRRAALRRTTPYVGGRRVAAHLKAEAVALLKLNQPVNEVARRLKLARSTVSRFKRQMEAGISKEAA